MIHNLTIEPTCSEPAFIMLNCTSEGSTVVMLVEFSGFQMERCTSTGGVVLAGTVERTAAP